MVPCAQEPWTVSLMSLDLVRVAIRGHRGFGLKYHSP